MKNEFARLLDELAAGRAAQLRRSVAGTDYTRVFAEPERLIVFGAGHVSQAVAELASKLDFAVTVVDDRPAFANRERFPDAAEIVVDGFADAIRALDIQPSDYVCVITRGHRCDGDCLRALLPGAEPYYLGMIGSRRRTSAQLKMLEDEGFDAGKIQRIHTPIGLPIRAQTPMEIAVSIAAELVLMRRSRPLDPTRLERTDADEAVLRFAAEPATPKAFMMVLESNGSTPAKTGSIMVVDADGRSAGTVGGGSCEAEALVAAARLIGTGRAEILDTDLSNEVAAAEGMACGGTLKMLIEDIPTGGDAR